MKNWKIDYSFSAYSAITEYMNWIVMPPVHAAPLPSSICVFVNFDSSDRPQDGLDILFPNFPTSAVSCGDVLCAFSNCEAYAKKMNVDLRYMFDGGDMHFVIGYDYSQERGLHQLMNSPSLLRVGSLPLLHFKEQSNRLFSSVLVKSPFLKNLTRLSFSQFELSVESCSALANPSNSPFSSLTSLKFHNCIASELACLHPLLSSSVLQNLTRLELDVFCSREARGSALDTIRILSTSPQMSKLKSLALDFSEFMFADHGLNAKGLKCITSSRILSNLTELALASTPLGTEAANLFFLSSTSSEFMLSKLLKLSFDRCAIGKEGVRSLVASTAFPPRLNSLSISQDEIDDSCCELLASDCPLVRHLQELSLSHNPLTGDGAMRLYSSPYNTNLTYLNVVNTQVDEGTMPQLIAANGKRGNLEFVYEATEPWYVDDEFSDYSENFGSEFGSDEEGEEDVEEGQQQEEEEEDGAEAQGHEQEEEEEEEEEEEGEDEGEAEAEGEEGEDSDE